MLHNEILKITRSACLSSPRTGSSKVLQSKSCLTSSSRPWRVNIAINQRRSIASTPRCLSGHNKWSKIRHNKAIQDSKRNVLYNRLARDIEIAINLGKYPDPALNPGLALAIKKAKTGGLPKANLERAIARASSGPESGGQDAIYEIMTAHRVGLIVQFNTSSLTRTKQALNKIVKDYNARFTPTSFLFSKKTVIRIVLGKKADLEGLLEVALDAGAEDIIELDAEEGSEVIQVEVIASSERLYPLTSILSSPPHSYTIEESGVEYRPLDPETARKEAEALDQEARKGLEKIIGELEEVEGCVGIWGSTD